MVPKHGIEPEIPVAPAEVPIGRDEQVLEPLAVIARAVGRSPLAATLLPPDSAIGGNVNSAAGRFSFSYFARASAMNCASLFGGVRSSGSR